MNIIVSEELKAYIDPLTSEEHEALERSIVAEGCRDALVLWGDLLVDGHNRYGICQKHGLPFETVQHPRFQSMEDVHLWMIDQHLGRRSVSDFQRGVLALRKREILQQRRARVQGTPEESAAMVSGQAEAMPAAPAPAPGTEPADSSPPWDVTPQEATALKSRSDIAKAARLSSNQVVLIEKIQNQAVPELVAAVKAGAISINAAAAVATLPEEEQKAAALGGRDDLKQAAKRVREVKRKAQDARGVADDGLAGNADQAPDELLALRQRVTALSEENEGLRKRVAELQAALQATASAQEPFTAPRSPDPHAGAGAR